MDFLSKFSLVDVAIVFIGLVIVSIVRIWYDSYVNNKKAMQFGNSLGIYNSLLDETKEGLLIITQNDDVVFTNTEAADILHTRTHSINKDFLQTVQIEDEVKSSKDSLLECIHTQTYMPMLTYGT